MFLFFSVARSPEIGSGERAAEGPLSNGVGGALAAADAASGSKPAAKASSKTPAKPKLGEFNIPGYISSPFQAHQWLNAA